jgi:hypothetical protein
VGVPDGDDVGLAAADDAVDLLIRGCRDDDVVEAAR